MSDQALTELYHWIPAPILMVALWFFFRAWLRGHEERLMGLVTRLEAATARLQDHDSVLVLLRRDADRHERELLKLRDRQHELGEELQLLNGRLEGSGPKRRPSRPSDDE